MTSIVLASLALASGLTPLPVREVTVFKDGHAFVLQQGTVATDERGDVTLDDLPVPVLGTFWPFSASREVKLLAVTAGRRRVANERTALALRELVEANPGAEARVTDDRGAVFTGSLAGIPSRSAEEIEAASPAGSGPRLREQGNVLLLDSDGGGTLALPLDQVRSVVFRGSYRARLAGEELRGRLVLDLDGPRRESAEVGMMYLQKGLRWIPGYRVAIDGAGHAEIQLQATLVNELTDLSDVTANLVVGVPSFAFKDLLDPMALQETAARLGPQFESGSATGYALSNALMTQVAQPALAGRMRGEAAADGGASLGPEVSGSEKEEDLFVFTVKHVSLRRGERMVLPVARYALEYRDEYTLDVSVAPPPELRAMRGEQPNPEIERLLSAPRVMHVLRIKNTAEHPLTTAPALLLSGERVLAQGTMTYTPRGAEVDLPVTAAVDIGVRKKDVESGRTPGALTVGSTTYGRVDVAGKITLTSHHASAVEIEVTRRILGHVGAADMGAKAEMQSAFEAGTGGMPPWWDWNGWPGWWHNVNGIGVFRWKVRLEPGASAELGAKWHYFWP